jgi:hypothetical protein
MKNTEIHRDFATFHECQTMRVGDFIEVGYYQNIHRVEFLNLRESSRNRVPLRPFILPLLARTDIDIGVDIWHIIDDNVDDFMVVFRESVLVLLIKQRLLFADESMRAFYDDKIVHDVVEDFQPV